MNEFFEFDRVFGISGLYICNTEKGIQQFKVGFYCEDYGIVFSNITYDSHE